jgi:hypothetical protein
MSRTDKDKPRKYLAADEQPVHDFAYGGTWRGIKEYSRWRVRRDRYKARRLLRQMEEPPSDQYKHSARYDYS